MIHGHSPRFALTLPGSIAENSDRWSGDALVALAAEIEGAGFHAVGVTEHPLPSTAWLDRGGHHALDPMVALSFLAAGSRHLQLLTQALVLPYHQPAMAAKALASLDALSGGRLIVGAAVGYLEAEFAAVGASHATRGRTFDAALEEMRTIWADRLPGHRARPRPGRDGGPPVWIGGNGPVARRRAAEVGDGWMPFAQGPRLASITGSEILQTIDDLAASVREVLERRAEAGRGPLEVCFGVSHRSALLREGATDGEIDDEVDALLGAGVTYVSLASQAAAPAELREEIGRWGTIVARLSGSPGTAPPHRTSTPLVAIGDLPFVDPATEWWLGTDTPRFAHDEMA